jgi:iron complex transport system substrate-binding protein
MTRLKFFLVPLLSLLTLIICSCERKPPGETRPSPFSITEKDGYYLTIDHFNRELALVPKDSKIPKELTEKLPPSQIVKIPVETVVLASGTYEASTIFGLGKEDAILGVVNPPGEWASHAIKERLSDGTIKYLGLYNAIDQESIVEMKPDVILIMSYSTLRQVDFLGFPVIADSGGALNDLDAQISMIEFMGVLLGEKEKGEKRAKELRENIEAVRERAEGLIRPKVTQGGYFAKKVSVIPKDYWLTELIKIAGGDYVFDDVISFDQEFTLEEFYRRSKDAEIFFLSRTNDIMGFDKKGDMIKWYDFLGEMKAFEDTGTLATTSDLLWEDSWHMDDMAMDLGAVIHPELYPGRELKYIIIFKD